MPKPKRKNEPVWKGPEVDGITQSMIAGFLVCRERFRIRIIEGLQPVPTFSVPLEYGTMWHLCEEVHANTPGTDKWKTDLKEHCQKLLIKYPDNRQDVTRWYEICKRQFPHYVTFWNQHKENREKTSIAQEHIFKIPYELPSGRIVQLRGKFDGVDQIKKGVWLQENKVKGNIDPQKLTTQLRFDLQTMTYLIALTEDKELGIKTKPKGVIYNVIKRPLSQGPGSIRKREGRMVNAKGRDGKPIKGPDGTNVKIRTGVETEQEFLDRLEGLIEEEPKSFFHRWKVAITKADIDNFKNQFLNPCLEHICQWYEFINTGQVTSNRSESLHYRFPYGVYNPIMERGSSDLEEYLNTGSTIGLHKVKTLFPELAE